jgi:hypothetical protein
MSKLKDFFKVIKWTDGSVPTEFINLQKQQMTIVRFKKEKRQK